MGWCEKVPAGSAHCKLCAGGCEWTAFARNATRAREFNVETTSVLARRAALDDSPTLWYDGTHYIPCRNGFLVSSAHFVDKVNNSLTQTRGAPTYPVEYPHAIRPTRSELSLVCREGAWRPAATTSTSNGAPCQRGAWLQPDDEMERDALTGAWVHRQAVGELMGDTASLGTFVEMPSLLEWTNGGDAR